MAWRERNRLVRRVLEIMSQDDWQGDERTEYSPYIYVSVFKTDYDGVYLEGRR
jgi:hypothetical protein